MNEGLFGYLTNITLFLSNFVIPFILGIAFLVFVVNVIRYFVIGGATEDGQKAAKAQALYSVAAFLVIFIFWGVVMLLTNTFNLSGGITPCPDYLINEVSDPCRQNQSRPPTNVGD